ncbi:hypothetical protein BD779DRAFT_1474923 [Infundibulicybe gibba]|nr:hypothetical protein BD779DRAFT_1474923 [Infundibulicybe gibba]
MSTVMSSTSPKADRPVFPFLVFHPHVLPGVALTTSRHSVFHQSWSYPFRHSTYFTRDDNEFITELPPMNSEEDVIQERLHQHDFTALQRQRRRRNPIIRLFRNLARGCQKRIRGLKEAFMKRGEEQTKAQGSSDREGAPANNVFVTCNVACLVAGTGRDAATDSGAWPIHSRCGGLKRGAHTGPPMIMVDLSSHSGRIGAGSQRREGTRGLTDSLGAAKPGCT